jgi:hypothetical protein
MTMAQARGSVIATRRLKGANGREVVVRLMAPVREADSTWVCAFEIRGLGRSPLNAGYGVDAFQALLNALEAIRVRLQQTGRALSWVSQGDPGFPRHVPYAFGPAFARRVGRLVDREVRRFVRDVTHRKRKWDLRQVD